MRIANIDHIIVVHCEEFVERFTYLNAQFNEIGFQSDYYDFKVNTHKDSLTKSTVDSYYNTNPDVRMKELVLIGEDRYLHKYINKGNISCGINHLLAWKDIAEHKEWNNVLVIEDDIIITESSLGNLCEVANHIPSIDKDFDIISLEDGAGLTVPGLYPLIRVDPDIPVYKSPDGRMRCTGAYIINKDACKKMVKINEKRKFTLEIDMQMWLYGKMGLLNIYWAEPCIFTQGSQKGVYKSSIQGSQLCTEFVTMKYINEYESVKEVLQVIYNGVDYGNKKMLDLSKGYNLEQNELCVKSMLDDHDFSALSLFPKEYESRVMDAFYPMKFCNAPLESSPKSVCSFINSNYFDGEIDVMFVDTNTESDPSLLNELLVESIVVNPRIIVVSQGSSTDQSILEKKRYSYIGYSCGHGFYIRKNIDVSALHL
jgi:GR25 family glycosyltransferase involved in LPS biosynthesis